MGEVCFFVDRLEEADVVGFFVFADEADELNTVGAGDAHDFLLFGEDLLPVFVVEGGVGFFEVSTDVLLFLLLGGCKLVDVGDGESLEDGRLGAHDFIIMMVIIFQIKI